MKTKKDVSDKLKSLVVVESPSKAKTINKYLGKSFVVESSVGHIKNLPKSRLGIDVANDYKADFITIRGKAAVINKLKKLAKTSKDVFIATDPDREGETIASNIAEEVRLHNENIHRVLFYEITPAGIKQAMEEPQDININLVNSQQARRAMDRLVGYKISPFLWKTVCPGLSAGRVQSVALRLIAEKESEIKAFKESEYWSILGSFETTQKESMVLKLFKIDGKELIVPEQKLVEELTAKNKIDRFHIIRSNHEVNDLKQKIEQESYHIKNIIKKESRRNPLPPFITSSLQQEASRRLRFSAKKTMVVAQQLYEGINLGNEGPIGLITYMRTDSTRLSDQSVEDIRKYISNQYGEQFLPAAPRTFKKNKSAQDAHEAIRPTSLNYPPEQIKSFLTQDQYLLYELIWKRFAACQMAQALLDQTTVLVEGGQFLFKTTGSVYKFKGFLQAYEDIAETTEKESDDKEKEDEPLSKILPKKMEENDPLNLSETFTNQHFTKPPARYTESRLVKELEAQGIGRPSTYSSIISTLVDRKYVEQTERKLFVTELGIEVNKILLDNFNDIFNVAFTAKMEDELDTITTGEKTYKEVLNDFYIPFNNILERLETEVNDIKGSLQKTTDQICEKCQKPMIIKWGRNGKFMACSGYPECKNTKPLEDTPTTETGDVCELCGSKMVYKIGRYGKFIACSNYPDCKQTKQITLKIACPKCKEGELVAKKTKSKRTFYGCSKYPGCDFASWYKPVTGECPDCNSSYLIETYSLKKGTVIKCPTCKKEFEQFKQVGNECPECKHPHLVESHHDTKGKLTKCPNCNKEFEWHKPINGKCSACGHSELIESFHYKKGKYITCPNCKKESVSTEE